MFDKNGGRTTDERRLEVGRLAYEESRRKYEQVDRHLEATRQRVLSLLGFVSAGLAFLAGSVVSDADLTSSGRGFAFAGTIAYGTFVAWALWMVMPVKNWRRGIEAQKITELYAGAEIGGSPEDAYREVAKVISQDATSNRLISDRVSKRVPGLVALCGIAQVLWLIAAWKA